MDHLYWSERSGRPRLQMPYLVEEPDDLENIDSFRILQEIETFEAGSTESLSEIAARAQTWLYFGLLKLWLEDSYCTNSFVENGYVHTKQLDKLLASHVKERGLSTRTGGGTVHNSYGMRVVECYQRVASKFSTRVVPQIVRLEHCDGQATPTLWNSAAYRVLFSIPILLSVLHKFLLANELVVPEALPDLRALGLVTETAGIARTVAASGRCPSLLRRLNLLEQHIYTLISLPSRLEHHVHENCSGTYCAVSDIDESNYKTRHTDDCVGSTCHPLGFDCESLYRVIDDGHIPPSLLQTGHQGRRDH